MFVGRPDTPPVTLSSAVLARRSDHMNTLAFKERHISRLTGRLPMRQQPKAVSFSIHGASTDAQHAQDTITSCDIILKAVMLSLFFFFPPVWREVGDAVSFFSEVPGRRSRSRSPLYSM